MNCQECRQKLVSLTEGLLEPSAQSEVESHLASCAACRAAADAMARIRERLVRNGESLSQPNLADRVMDAISRRQSTEGKGKGVMTIVLKYRKGLSAAAAALLLAATAVVILLLGNSTSAVFAIERAAEAARKVTSIHFQEWVPLSALEEEAPADSDMTKSAWADFNRIEGDLALRQEVWAEFDGQGQLVRLRLEWPVTEDGRKEILLTPSQADVWFVHKRGYLVLREERAVAAYSQAMLDPTRRIERLDAAIKAGTAKIESTETSRTEGTVTYKVVYRDDPARSARYVIDQASHLLKEAHFYEKSDGADVLVDVLKFIDYDKPIDAAKWVLDAPGDVMRVDWLTQVIGLAKGDMTDAEVAKEGVRQFFEAVIAGDYETAGRLYSGVPADKMREMFSKIRFVRIVSLGEPITPPDPRVGGFVVPYKVEIGVNGKVSVKEGSAAIRPVYGQPDRWAIHGGI